jgi:ribosomal protein L30E
MSKLLAVVGDTGTGKSHSIQFLNPKETYIINVAGKELPFKGSSKLYNTDNKNYKDVQDANEIQRLIMTIAEKADHIKTIIIEDGNYIMGFNLVDKATEIGYTKFSVMAQDMKNLIQKAKKLRDDLTIIYFSHQEEVDDSGEITTYKMKTAGKLIDSQIKLEGLFTVVLYAITETKGEKTDYFFVTNRFKKYPAKSPSGMFSELKLPNNLKIVTEAISEYYN